MAKPVLNGLSRGFQSLIVALDALGNEDRFLTFYFVKCRLVQEGQNSEMHNHIATELQ